MRLHRHCTYPLSWVLDIYIYDWALPFAFAIRSLIDGSGRRAHVTCVSVSFLCLHWDIHYAWGRRLLLPPLGHIPSFSEIMGRDRSWPLNMEYDPSISEDD